MSSTIPQGYTVAQLDDKQWYPIKVERTYNADCPEGYINLRTLYAFVESEWKDDIHFARRSDALAYCQQEVLSQQKQEERKWEEYTLKSDVYPDRCIHYIDLITEITGRPPLVHQFIYHDVPYNRISVFVYPWRCSCEWHTVEMAENALSIEDALEEAANSVYVSYQACQCSYAEQEHLLSVAI
jgi:hypothetical protein